VSRETTASEFRMEQFSFTEGRIMVSSPSFLSVDKHFLQLDAIEYQIIRNYIHQRRSGNRLTRYGVFEAIYV
jgi:hypothetical protein